MRRLAARAGAARSRGGASVAGILKGILEGDVFLRELTVEFGSVGVCGGDWRRGCRERCLLRWRAVIGVLEDSCWKLAYVQRGGVDREAIVPLGLLAEGLGGE
jgi:hypothetical protein